VKHVTELLLFWGYMNCKQLSPCHRYFVLFNNERHERPTCLSMVCFY